MIRVAVTALGGGTLLEVDALEVAVGQDHESIAVRNDDVDRLAWAVAHGRKRPW